MFTRASLGFDFGTESVRVLVVDISNGNLLGQSSCNYEHGVLDRQLPTGEFLELDFAFQHPLDWLTASAAACKQACSQAGPVNIVGIGVDFTSCTMLPAKADGTPLCIIPQFAHEPMAWPKLWKHHGAKAETDRINAIAHERNEPWLKRYGGVIGLEWFFPKVLETINRAPAIYEAAEVWLEAGDWIVWQFVEGPFPACKPDIIRSTCQAGYKAMWNRETGYPSPDYFRAVHPKLTNIVEQKMPGRLLSPGVSAGNLTPAAAALLGLSSGIPVSTAIIDAHAGVAGAGVAEVGTMVLVMGTSSCHMLNSDIERLAPGIAGVVQDGILPGFFGYETGQSSVGDAFAWLVSTTKLSHSELTQKATLLPPGSGGVLALDWFNGCRTPLMDGRVSGLFVGLALSTKPEQLYRALLEATAMGVRWIVDLLRDGGVPVHRFVASGGLPAKSPLLMQIYSDVLNTPISIATSDQPCGLGAAILGCAASGALSLSQAVHTLAPQTERRYTPCATAAKVYDDLYKLYRRLADADSVIASTMRELRQLE